MNNDDNNRTNTTYTQALRSLSDFSLHVRSSSFAFSIIINLQSFSPFPNPACCRPVDGCPNPAAASSRSQRGSTFIALSEILYVFDLAKLATSDVPN